MQEDTNENKYSFELKDLTYEELIVVYKEMCGMCSSNEQQTF